MSSPKLVMAIHDISGIGRSSLGVIIPTMSVLGIQVCSVPTAVLSTHTGGFGAVASKDLTDYMEDALGHYQTLDLNVAGVYTGFLGSSKQIDLCGEYFKAYPESIKLVDPVMGDDGKAYKTIDKKIQQEMKKLVAMGDIITPNLTEACMLLGIDYPTGNPSLGWCKDILAELGKLGGKEIILKGMTFKAGKITNLLYNKQSGAVSQSTLNRIPTAYPGTGDIFAASFLSLLLRGKSSVEALEISGRFLEYAIGYSYEQRCETKYGILLEDCLSWFLTNVKF